ncbi:MAG: hypothetical protein QOF37_2946, partial [Thermoleophilaceae bacterium]|nr:hypothetical protein [Thermoleophilaceae bacterium]
GDPVWVLASAALILQTVRHAIAFSYGAAQHQAIGAAPQRPLEEADDGARPPSPAGGRGGVGGLVGISNRLNSVPGVLWVKRIVAFPIGERFAVISLTAAIWSPRVTFTVLLAWGLFATAYALPGQVLRTLTSRGRREERTDIELFRDDGPLARALGMRLRVPPVVMVGAGVVPLLAAMALTGDDASNGLVASAIAWFVVFAGLSSATPHTDRLRWLVPPLLRLGEYSALVWVAVCAGRSSAPSAFAVLCVLAFRHYDLVYRLRHQGGPPPEWLGVLAGGWDGRLILGGLLLAAGALPAGFYVLAGLLGAVLVTESVASWVRYARQTGGAATYDDDQEDEIQ